RVSSEQCASHKAECGTGKQTGEGRQIPSSVIVVYMRQTDGIIPAALIAFSHSVCWKPVGNRQVLYSSSQSEIVRVGPLFQPLFADCIVYQNGRLFCLRNGLLNSGVETSNTRPAALPFASLGAAGRAGKHVANVSGLFIYGSVPEDDFAATVRTGK